MYSSLPIDAQCAALFDAHTELDGAPSGDLRLIHGRVDDVDLIAVAFDYTRNHGSLGVQESAQIVHAIEAAARTECALVFLLNTSGVRVTDGNHGVAALRRLLRAALDARLQGVPMLALIARNCFGGASVLASLCTQRVVNQASLYGMSGPKPIEQISGVADLIASDKEAVKRLLGGAARCAASDGFRCVDDDAQAYRDALRDWLRHLERPVIGAQRLRDIADGLRARLRAAGRWHDGNPLRPWTSVAFDRTMQRLLNRRVAVERCGAFVRGTAVPGDRDLLLGFVESTYATAVDAQRLLDAACSISADVTRLLLVLDCESHAATAADESVVFSEYLGAMALQLRLLHRQGIAVELVVTGESGGGIFAALSAAASKVVMLSSARMRVLPTAAMAAINKSEDERGTTPQHARETGAVDAVLDDAGTPPHTRIDHNFYALLVEARTATATQPCLETESGTRCTFDDLDRLAAQYAHALCGLGCVPGDRVAVQVEKSPRALALFLGCLRAGLVYLPLNTAYRSAELTHFLTDARPRVFVCSEAGRAAMREFATSLGVACVEGMDQDGDGSLSRLAATLPQTFATVARAGEDIATIMYTSGTTGRSKGATISHRAIRFCAEGLAKYWGFTPQDVLYHALPIFHAHGLFISTCVVLFSGGSLLFHRKFDLDAALDALPRATAMMAVPTFYHRLLADDRLTADKCRQVRLFTSGSAPLSATVHNAISERVGHQILERYGATETMILTSNPLHGERRPGSVGLPLPGVDLRIADAQDRPLPRGQVGMIQVRSAGLFSGYWQLPEKTAQEFTDDGFFRTGDIGTQSDDGYVTINGRAKDLIISGGYNVYPSEVESVLDAHHAVSESAVIGVTHADFGEAVMAVVTLRTEAAAVSGDELIAWLKARLANYKIPKHVVFVEQLPRNAMGKVQKNVLRDTYAHLGQSARARA